MRKRFALAETSYLWHVLMRQDAKLGLALGMLVIGFAVAFCFPRAQDFSTWKPDVTEVAATEDFLPIKAYRPDPIETLPSPEVVVDHQITKDLLNNQARLPQPVKPLLDSLKLHPPAQSSIADLLTSESTDKEHPAKLVPDQDNITDPNVETPTSVAEPTIVAATEDSQSPAKTYLVQPGDTLTGIAYRTMGASNRYLDLYEANRDVLASPDDLRVGLELRIPGNAQSTAEQNAQVISQQRTVQDDRKLFGRPAVTPFMSEKTNSAMSQGPHTHRIEPGDTLEGISLKYYRDPRGVQVIQEANPSIDPSRLKLGMELEIPVRR